ncbi:MAG TPA: Gfo/Idh/MocA family oxidoreductase, partial [Candidatus Dormibacteraeota bacterium]|nr:Gfo/Idh/MocA family oxidoreductase [Candidatus Dormibacteraeota bacterium]
MGIGVIGYGYWGPNLVRNFSETPGAFVAAVSDLDPVRLRTAKARVPNARLTTQVADILDDPAVGAVVIATPVASHFDLAMASLDAGKHVLLTKPMTQTAAQARLLINRAADLGLTLMVDHTFVYHGAVRKIRQLVQDDQLGRILYYDSVRVNLGLFQSDVDVLWDLAVHDLSIMDYVLGQTPVAVAATGARHVEGRPYNMAYLTCFFENDLIAHLHVNWLAPVKVRRTLIGGDRKMIVYDDLEPSEKV